MKVLVTGATGFLGTNLVLECIEKGYDVRAFGLPGSETKYIKDLGVEIMFGDVSDPESVKKAMEGMDYAIHSAGDTSFWNKLFERQRKTNIEGPRTIMQAALNAGVKRVVHTSTVDTFGYNPNGLADETWADYNYTGWKYNYGDTKREGEKVALSFVDKGLEVVIINPGSMIGPYDHTLQFGRLFMDMQSENLPGIPAGGAPWAHVREVAKAHVTALDKGRVGEKYICGGRNATYKEIFGLIADSIGIKPPIIVFPKWLLVFYGGFSEFISRFTHKKPDMNPGQARYMSVFPKYDSSKAQRELGFQCITLEEMVKDARDWYVENGFLELKT